MRPRNEPRSCCQNNTRMGAAAKKAVATKAARKKPAATK